MFIRLSVFLLQFNIFIIVYIIFFVSLKENTAINAFGGNVASTVPLCGFVSYHSTLLRQLCCLTLPDAKVPFRVL